jgi:hypothetical protein
MRKRIGKTVQKLMLVITFVGLLTGTFGTVAAIRFTNSAPPTEITLSQKVISDTETAKGTSITGEYTPSYTINFSEDDISFSKLFGYDLVTMNDCSCLPDVGKPMMPVKHSILALPQGMKATTIRILDIQKQTIPGLYTIYPAQKPLPVGTTDETMMNMHLNKATYLSPLPYPTKRISLGEQTDLAGQSMIEISVYPLQYLSLQKKLCLMTSITFSIEGINGYTCGDYVSEHISNTNRDMYHQMIQDLVVNPEDVELHTSPNPQPLGVGPGDYDYVIITQATWVSAFQPLADWKTQKGVPATIVTTDWIYNSGGYSGTNVQKIRAFVQDAYTNWGTIYVLLGGDTNVVPCHTRTFSGVDPDPVPNDVYYADFDSDWVCEVNIGRASVTGPGTGTGQIGNFINKILIYETDPPLTNYAKNAGFFGFDLDSWTHAEQCKINIKNAYIPASWTVTTVYDSQGGNHQTNVINALNAGQNLVNHADHSNNDCMGTGYINHDWLIYNDDMDALTNGNKQSILYSMGCDPAAFDVTNCIAEHFVRNSNGGGIAFIGNSRYGWYNYGNYNSLSMEYDVHFFESLFQENLYHLGAAFSDHKNDVMQSHSGSDIYQYCYTELTLLGDPELPIWTEDPSYFVVSHPQTIPLASSSFTVHVETNSGSNIQNAYVCLWKEDEIYERDFTNSAGDATFTIAPETGGNMDVTVTKQNYLPSESSASVIEENVPPNQPSSPNPGNAATNVPIYSDLSWTGGDPNPGDTVTYDVYFGTSSTPPKVVNNQSTTTYDPGIMNYITTYYWKIIAWDSYGEFTIGPLWSFTTKANSPPIFGATSPTNGSTGNPLGFTWNIPINDPEGNIFSWTIQCNNGQTNSGASSTNGTKSLTLSGLAYSTLYKVWVNATDPGGSGIYTRRWYTFTTKANLPPIFGTPVPANGSTNTPLDITWSIPINDPEGDMFSWTIQCSNGQANSGIGASNGTKSLMLSGLAYSAMYKVWVNATDSSGSGMYTRKWFSFTTELDSTPPVTTMICNGTMGDNGWYIDPIIVSFNATDTQSGVLLTMFKIDNGGWTTYTIPFLISIDGNHVISYYSVDLAGNTETTKIAAANIDGTAPIITLTKQQIDLFTIKFTAQTSDETSGVDRVEFYLDGQLQLNDTQSPYEWTWTGIGQYSVTATVYDMAGNSQSQSMSTPYSFNSWTTSNELQTLGFVLKQQMNK